MNLLIKSTTFLAFLATSGVNANAGCNDAGPAMGMMAAKSIVNGSDWFKNNCDSMAWMYHINPKTECKQFAINYCIGNMKDAVEEFHCRGTPPTSLLNSWANECSYKVSSFSFLPHHLLPPQLQHTTLSRKDTKLERKLLTTSTVATRQSVGEIRLTMKSKSSSTKSSLRIKARLMKEHLTRVQT